MGLKNKQGLNFAGVKHPHNKINVNLTGKKGPVENPRTKML